MGHPFQSTPSGGKATGTILVCINRGGVSIHAFRGEGDATHTASAASSGGFNPRLPGGRRPRYSTNIPRNIPFQSTPSGGKATSLSLSQLAVFVVSIHAFRGEGDQATGPNWKNAWFQSTPSGGKATQEVYRPEDYTRRFNPRLPGGRRLSPVLVGIEWRWVSIHAFRGEGDNQQTR